MKNNREYIKWGLTAFFVVLGGFVSYYVIFHIDSFSLSIRNLFAILMPIIDGFILAYLLTPLVNATERLITTPFFVLIKKEDKKNPKRFLSIIITDVLVLWSLYSLFSIVIPQIANSIKTILEQFPSYINTFGLWISKLLNDNPEFQKSFMDFLNESSMDFTTVINTEVLPQLNSINNVMEMLSQFSGIINVITSVSMSVYSIFREIWNLVIGFVISIYLLASKELFAAQAKKIVYAFCSVNRANRFISNVRFAHKTFGGFFVGKILDSIIIGVICFAVTSILGVFKGYALLALIVSVLCVGLPVFDTIFAMLRRMAKHQPIMQADRGHLHHRLIDRGFSQRQAVLILYAISLFLGLSAIFISFKDSRTIVVVLLMVIVLSFIIYYFNAHIKNRNQ